MTENAARETYGDDQDMNMEDIEEKRRERQMYSMEYPNTRLIDQDLLKKYILYAKTHVHPVINDVDNEKIARMYV